MSTERYDAEPTLDWRTLDLAGKNAIEASAGTGKTYTLVLLVLRLLLERELPPSAILLATFTDAATLELRVRVRERVRQAYFAALRPKDSRRIASEQNAMASTDPLAQYLSARWQTDAFELDVLPRQNKRIKASVRLRDEKILARAMLQIDEMPIRTLHGICRQLLSSFDLIPGDMDADIENGEALTEAALDDAFRRRFTDVKVLSDTQLDALDEPFLAALRDGVRRVLRNGRITLRPAVRADAENYRKARAALFSPSFRKALKEALADASGEWRLRIEAKRAIEDLLRTLNRGVGRQLPKASLAIFVQPGSAQFKKARRSILDNSALARLCHFARVHQFAVRGEFATLLNSLVTEVRLSRSISLAARGGVSFDSMIEQLAERLAPTEGRNFDARAAEQLANAIHQRYPAALIDEFQDTDAQQWAILQAIYGTRGGLVLVGDPKQSIYRFRGSDVHTFVRATKTCERYFLQHNYRATAPLVAALNGFYGAVAQPFHSADIAFRAALVGRSDSDALLAAVKPLLFIEVLDAQERYTASDACIRAACSDIKNALVDAGRAAKAALTAHPGQAKEAFSIALLLSTNSQVRTAQDYLRELGVHASASATLGVYQSHAAHVLQCVLCALAAPADLTRARAARLALQLDALEHVSALDERALFSWVEHCLSQMLARGIGYLCLILAIEPVCADAQFARDASHLAELLALDEQALLAAKPNLRESSTGYAQALWQAVNAHIEQPAHNESPERRRIEAGAQVQVLTVHKAKGLEFDLVYLPTLCFAKAADTHVAIIPGAQGLECDAGSADFESAMRLEADENLAELLRLQYVALTRAKQAVNVYFKADSVKDSSALGWHLVQTTATQRPQQVAGLAAEPVAEQVEPAWEDQINAAPPPAPAPAAVALKPWRAGLELLVKHENIGYLAREVPDFAPLTTLSMPATAKPTSQRADWLPALRPPQRRISFSSMTQTEAKSDAALVNETDAHKPNFELIAEIAATTVATQDATQDAAQIELALRSHPTGADAHPEIIALEKFRGPNFGLALHTLFEDALPGASELNADQVAARLSEFGFATDAQSTQAILALVLRNRQQALVTELVTELNLTSAVNLARLNSKSCIAELGFQLPVSGLDYRALAKLGPRFGLPLLFLPEQALDRVDGMLIGFIDLVFQSGGKFYLLDYKSNWLGASLQDYSGAALEAAMAQHFYHLQHLLYALALHRYLRLSLPDYDFDTHFGGVHYLFVRAFGLQPELSCAGHYQYRAPRELIEELDGMFLGELRA